MRLLSRENFFPVLGADGQKNDRWDIEPIRWRKMRWMLPADLFHKHDDRERAFPSRRKFCGGTESDPPLFNMPRRARSTRRACNRTTSKSRRASRTAVYVI